jgi:pimeloyl-ACP methyl ester carboxylesterase
MQNTHNEPAISSYLFTNNLRLHYLHWNLKDSGRPIVLLHGLASNARIWELVAPRLADRGFTLLAPDARGHGLTDKPDDYSFQAVTGDLAAFIEAHHLDHPLLVGHSWGGSLALDYAARYALGSHTPAGIVLVDGGLNQLDDSPGATWEDIQERLTPPRLAGTPLVEFVAKLKEWNASWLPDGEAQEEIISIILANFTISEDGTIAPHLTFERHMQIVRAMWEFKTYERIARLRCPGLAILARPAPSNGPGDQGYLTAKEHAVAYVKEIKPDLKVLWMENTIHDIPLQRPEELARLISNFASAFTPPPSL